MKSAVAWLAVRRGRRRVARRTVRACLCAFALAALTPSTSRARETKPHVDVTIVGSADPALEESITQLLAGSGLEARIIHVTPDQPGLSDGKPTDAIALVRLVLGREEGVSLLIVDPRRRRALVRSLPIPEGSEDIVREEASHIVVYSVEAIARGEDVGEPQPEPPPQNVSTREGGSTTGRAARHASTWFQLESVAAARTYSTVAPFVVGTGAALVLATERGGVRLGGGIGFEQRSRIIVTTPSVAARFAQRSLHASARADVPIAPGVVFRTTAGVAVDLVSVTTTALRPSSQPRRTAFIDAVPVLDATAGIAAELAPRLAASATVGIELPLSTSDYIVEDDRGRDLILLSPHSLRLVARLTLSVRF